MELSLNLAWLTVAGTMVCLWLRNGGNAESDRRLQLIAIAVLVAILFPVISVSDDLLAVQNASETDNYLRRNHLVPSDTHPVHPVLAVAVPIVSSGLGLAFSRFIAPQLLPVHPPKHPELAEIDSRPPPQLA
jgi:hypothetical protein